MKRFKDDYIFFRRCTDKRNQNSTDRVAIKKFVQEFQSMYLQRLNECHLGILLSRTTNFVGTRTLALSIKFISLNMKYKETRELIRPKIDAILFNLSLPLFVTS